MRYVPTLSVFSPRATRSLTGAALLVPLLLVACGGSDGPTAPSAVATTIRLSASALAFSSLEETRQITATVLDQNGGAMSGVSPTWTTSDASVASVTSGGAVTAEGNGSATLTAATGGVTAEVSVTVEQAAVSVEPADTLVVLTVPGSTDTVSVSVRDGGGSAITGVSVTWTSADEGVATVSADGVVTAVAAGTTTLTAEATAGGASATGTLAVVVNGTLVITTDSLPTGDKNLAYSPLQLEAVGGGGGYVWSVATGSLPAGLALADSGEVSGIPLVPGTETFTVAVESADGQTAERSFTVLVNDTPFLLPGDLCSANPAGSIATFEDAGLEAAVRSALGLGGADDLACPLLATLTALDASDSGIVSLVGAQNLAGLDSLVLGGNEISDITPLEGMVGLEILILTGNFITDIGPVSGLTALQVLNANENQITDIAAVAGLTDLWALGLLGNAVVDISPVAGLTALTELDLRVNAISDISALSGLTNLRDFVGLGGNQITDLTALGGLVQIISLDLNGNADLSDISPLLANTGLGSGDGVGLLGTSVSCADVAALEAKGVTVYSDCP